MQPSAIRPDESPPVADESAPTAHSTPVRGHRALRRWRASIPDRTYFITACTHQRERLFATEAIAALLFEHLRALEPSRHITLIASVVMPDHMHGVFTLRGDNSLAAVMRRFRGTSACAINRSLGRTGPVWERGYFDRLLRLDERLEPVLHYLWHNPIPPGQHFRCRGDVWTWFRTCVRHAPKYYEWLKQNP